MNKHEHVKGPRKTITFHDWNTQLELIPNPPNSKCFVGAGFQPIEKSAPFQDPNQTGHIGDGSASSCQLTYRNGSAPLLQIADMQLSFSLLDNFQTVPKTPASKFYQILAFLQAGQSMLVYIFPVTLIPSTVLAKGLST